MSIIKKWLREWFNWLSTRAMNSRRHTGSCLASGASVSTGAFPLNQDFKRWAAHGDARVIEW